MSDRHPTVKDVITAHEVVKQKSEVRTEGFRSSQQRALEKIQEIIETAKHEEDIYISAAVYLKKLIDKHPFNDGNKRTAIMITERFLEENNEQLKPHKIHNTEELYDTVKWELPSMNIEETAHWLKTGEVSDDNSN